MEAEADPGSGLQHIRIHITELFFTVKNSVITGHNFFLSEDINIHNVTGIESDLKYLTNTGTVIII